LAFKKNLKYIGYVREVDLEDVTQEPAICEYPVITSVVNLDAIKKDEGYRSSPSLSKIEIEKFENFEIRKFKNLKSKIQTLIQ
jgi:hypothetical protein